MGKFRLEVRDRQLMQEPRKTNFRYLSGADATNLLRFYIENLIDEEKKREEAYRRFAASPGTADEISQNIEDVIDKWNSGVEHVIMQLTRFPRHFIKHAEKLSDFYRHYDYDKSIFAMTKFPDSEKADNHEQLATVISCVEVAVRSCGYEPRIARGSSRYYDALWENVELHLLGCSRGIAIVEDKAKTELNPNVAMEWGFMRAMGKPVLYLEEESFSSSRADWSGLIHDQFSWTNPAPGIENAIANWLKKR